MKAQSQTGRYAIGPIQPMRADKLVPMAAGALVLLLAALPVAIGNPYYVHLAGGVLIFAVALLGLDLVVGYIGEISLGHAGLFGIGAYATGLAGVELGLSVPAALAMGMLCTAALSALLAIPSLRVAGPYLAMVTLAFGAVLQILLNEMDFLTRGPLGLKLPEMPGAFGMTPAVTIYALVAMVSGLVFWFSWRLRRTSLIRSLRAIGADSLAADSCGINVYGAKVLAFTLSGVIIGLAGGLLALFERYLSPSTFSPELSIMLVLGLILGGRRSLLGALVGASVIVVLPSVLSNIAFVRWGTAALTAALFLSHLVKLKTGKKLTDSEVWLLIALTAGTAFAFNLDAVNDLRLVIFGLMILIVMSYLPNGVLSLVNSPGLRAKPDEDDDEGESAWFHSLRAPSTAQSAVKGGVLLSVRSVCKRFGGVLALNGLDLDIRRGSIFGLIGPNGSGKSTAINTLSAIYRPTTGVIEFDGVQISQLKPYQVARMGMARTFQNIRLFNGLSCLENLMAASDSKYKASFVGQLFGTSHATRLHLEQVDHSRQVLRLCGILHLQQQNVESLSYGTQRMVELARALALKPSIILLDEPAAGLGKQETLALSSLIGRIRATGVTVIVVEHHMDLIMAVCDRIAVLDFGSKLFEGTPEEVKTSSTVIEAYLGSGD